MKRKGIHKPTIEDAIEIGGIETLHPGGFALTKRTAEITGMGPGLKVLDVSSGRGTQAVFYAKEYGVEVVGLDISEEMIHTAGEKAKAEGLIGQVTFVQGDSQQLPFEDNTFDIVINECAVGIPDDSQKVLNEMVRVTKSSGAIAIHESTWRKKLANVRKDEIAERYGTTPLEFDEWVTMLKHAGVRGIITEFDEWSKPEMFWNIRKDKEVNHYSRVMSFSEKLLTIRRIWKKYGLRGVFKVLHNERIFWRVVLNGELGYCLFKGIK